MDSVRVGVIGVGRMGQRHCRVYSTLRRARLVGVCDPARAQGEAIAREYDVTYHAELDDLLDRVDAVTLAVPTPLHASLTVHCLQRGVHVLVEKPLAQNLTEAQMLCDTAQTHGRILQVGHIERFNPAYLEFRSVLQDLTPLAINIHRLSAYQGSNTDVDVVLDLMVHDIDLVLDLMGGPPAELHAYGLTAHNGMVDYAIAHLRFAAGPLITLVASRVTEHKVRTIDASTLEAYVECDLLNKTVALNRCTVGEYLNHSRAGVRYRQESMIERIHVPAVEPLYLELQHFVDCVLDGQICQVPADHGLRTMRLAEEIRAQAYEGLVAVARRDQKQPLCDLAHCADAGG